MQITGGWTIFAFGCGGGACLELLRWWKLRESANFPEYWHRKVYWLLTLAMIAVGGGMAVVYGTGPTNAIQAMNIGAAAPAILGALSAVPGGGTTGGRSRKFDGSTPIHNRFRQFLTFG
jgi:hypothetical protein